jgi:hypothetical protein
VTANQEVKLHLLAGLMAKTKNLGKVFQSPFRYPGGKGFLSEYLENELLKIDVDIPDYKITFSGQG